MNNADYLAHQDMDECAEWAEKHRAELHRIAHMPRSRCHELVSHTLPEEPKRGGLVRCITWVALLVFAMGTGFALINAVEYITTPDMIGSKQ